MKDVLYPKDHKVTAEAPAPTLSVARKTEIKNAIKAFTTQPRHYTEIEKHIRSLPGPVLELRALIDEVRNEWHPAKVEEPGDLGDLGGRD